MTGLKREIGLIPAIATAVGIVVSSSALLMLGQGFGLGGPAFIVAMLIAATVNLCVAFSFAELTSLIPAAGGINHYTLPAMGRTVGIFAVLAGYFLVSILSNAAESTIAGNVLHDFFFPSISPTLWAFILMTILTLINFRGVKSYAYSQVFLAGSMIISMVILSCIGIFGLGSGTPLETKLTFDMAAGGGILSMLGIAFWLFVGLEFVCPLAEEIINPQRFIPIAMISALVIIFISDTLFGFMAMKYLGVEGLAASGTPHVDAAGAVLGRTGQIWIGIISIIATGSTLNTFIAAIPRMLYGMAKEGEFPRVFAKINRWGAPWVGVLLTYLITIVLLVFNDPNSVSMISTFVLSGCIGWMICYVIAHIDVLILRKKYPDAKRSFKVPFGPVLPILSSFGLIYMMIFIYPDADGKIINEVSSIIFKFAGTALGICALWSIFWVKVVMKKPLFETVPMEKLVKELEETA
mgnify:FL=1